MWVFCLVLLALVGCAGAGASNAPRTTSNASGGYPPPAAYPTGTGYYTSQSDALPSAPPTAGATADAPRTSSPGEGRTSESIPRERPGLGTEWGETRFSRVRETSFVRSDADRPFAVVTVHYNDRPGVEALAGYHGGGGRMREFAARGGAITVSIRGSSGEPLEALHVGDRTYVIGQAGERYSIVMSNHTGHRFEAVSTVDGLDVINGRNGNLQNRGYVLLPYATLEIDGFRQSTEAVAAFRFGRVADSYAAQTGSARNVGVIGMAFFGERGDVYSEEELETRDTANPFPGSDLRFARPPR
jgi:hypothetical protein